MRDDPIVRALERFGEIGECLQYGDGWSCRMPAAPEGPPRLMGHDDRANEVWMRRFRCVAGHWYEVETPPAHGEAPYSGICTTPRATVSVSRGRE